jgi:UDP-N-acetyl-D-mannosaminuronic acid dehydrogenase
MPVDWTVRKIGVVGPGIVGTPMAAMLAHARVCEGTTEPATVTVLQRRSPTSAWKVDAINAGRSPIGGVEPDLDRIVAEASAAGLLRATHDAGELADADVILVCVQTDKRGTAPDYGPLFEALTDLVGALRRKPVGNLPLVVFESTLAPSSMATVIREHFSQAGLEEGRDVLLGNSPNRVMPGRLVERVSTSDKIVAGLHPGTPELIARLYRRIVTAGVLLPTNSLTAEIVKTLENAYRDVRIAYAAELVRHCDEADLDFYELRDAVNQALAQVDKASRDSAVVPTGGVLIPTVGVGGHCLPKDGILLWWRALEGGEDSADSLILEARRINDRSPAHALAQAERAFGELARRPVAVLGAAYRPDSEDTRNSPSLAFVRLLQDRGCRVALHDPFVRPDDQNLKRFGLEPLYTQDLEQALGGAELAFVCAAHRAYGERAEVMRRLGSRLGGVFDACNLFTPAAFEQGPRYAGIGRGRGRPSGSLVTAATEGFRAVERGIANEVQRLVNYLNDHHAADSFNRVRFGEVQRLAGTCGTGCVIGDPGPVVAPPTGSGFASRLVELAARAHRRTSS